MFTNTTPTAAVSTVCSTSSANSSSSKSCKKCQEIYAMLSVHVMTQHAFVSGTDGILNNVLLSILSLMSTTTQSTNASTSFISSSSSSPEQCQTVPTPGISKTEKKRSPKANTEHLPVEDLSTSAIMNTQTFSNNYVNTQTGLPVRIAFQPELVSPLFPSSSHHQKIIDSSTASTLVQTLTRPKLLQVQNPLDLSFLVPQGNEFQHTTGFISPDGTLTPAGISLLLANQNKTGNASGKSDLDVADILVNKMPIPSLNKALDPSLLQLSTIYLQQLALGQHQPPLSAISASAAHFSDDLANLVKSTNLHQASMTTTTKTVDQTESLQQLIARHKQISGLIDALSNKEKSSKSSGSKSDVNIVGNNATVGYSIVPQNLLESPLPSIAVVSSSIISGKNAIPVSILPVLPSLRQDSATSDVQTYSDGKMNLAGKLVINHAGNSETKRNIPVLLENTPANEALLNLIKTPGRIPVLSDSDIQFFRHKSDGSASVGGSSSPLPSKAALHALHNLIIETAKDVDGDDNDAKSKGNESESSRKRRYSSVTMVPISQYNPLDPTTEPMPTRIPSVEPKVLYKCDVCSVTFSVLSTLQAHAKIHVSEKIETCNYCHLSFTDHDEFFRHVASHRGEENIFSCPYCPKIFTSKGDYNKHITKHTQRRPYLCSHCQKAFRDPGSLTKHERIHTGEQPYVCEVCNRGFAEKSSLRKHVRVHSGEKPYKCDQCDKSFSISGNLQRHLFIHTGERPFKCTECSRSFNNPSHLRRHIKNLHGKIPKTEKAEDTKQFDALVVPRLNAVVSEMQHEAMNGL